MDTNTVLTAMSALSQATRLETFQLLVRHEPAGLPAGEVARLLDIPQNTMSTHLSVLARAGLVTAERHSRSIVYRASLDQLRDVMVFLAKDCCGGNPILCAPLVDALRRCC